MCVRLCAWLAACVGVWLCGRLVVGVRGCVCVRGCGCMCGCVGACVCDWLLVCVCV